MEHAAFTAGIPKVELHLHLEGALEPELEQELARRNGVGAARGTAVEVLVTRADFHDLAAACFRRLAAQDVRHAEVSFDAQVHLARGVAFEDVVLGLHDAAAQARRDLGLSVGLVLSLVRDLPLESAEAALEAATGFREEIVGVGLGSGARDDAPAVFAPLLARARAAGFALSAHGDVARGGAPGHLRRLLEDVGVDRLDHGTDVAGDPRLLALVLERGTGLTCSPLSNAAATGDSRAPVIADLLRRGVKVAVGSGHPARSGGYATENVVALTREADLTFDEIIRLQRNAIEISWAGEQVREEFLAELDAFEALVAPDL